MCYTFFIFYFVSTKKCEVKNMKVKDLFKIIFFIIFVVGTMLLSSCSFSINPNDQGGVTVTPGENDILVIPYTFRSHRYSHLGSGFLCDIFFILFNLFTCYRFIYVQLIYIFFVNGQLMGFRAGCPRICYFDM